MGYLNLLLAVASLGMLGVLHKVADHRGCRPQAINLLLFLCASLLLGVAASIRSGPAAVFSLPGRVLAIGAMCGICAGLAILNFQHAVRFGKISTSWLLINLSMAVPTALSIFIYSEQVTPKRALSMIPTVAALVLLWIDRRQEERKANRSPVSDGNERSI
jgi:drug/metabolite transporter (DMT)-like permease